MSQAQTIQAMLAGELPAVANTQDAFDWLVTAIAESVWKKIGGGSLLQVKAAVAGEIKANTVAESFDARTGELTLTLTLPDADEEYDPRAPR